MALTLKNTLQPLLPGERRQFFLFAFADLLIAILDIALLTVLLALANNYLQPGNRHSILPHFFSSHSLISLAMVLFILFVVKNGAAYVAASAQFRFVYTVAARLSEKNCAAFLEGSYQNYVATDTAVYIKQISQQPVEYAHYVLNGWQQIITQGLLLLITTAALLLYSPEIFLLLAVLLAAPVFLLFFYNRKKIRQARGAVKQSGEISLQYLKEALAGFIESRMYQKEIFFTARYAAKQQQLNHNLSKLQSVQALPARFLELFMVAGFVLMVLVSSAGSQPGLPLFTVGAFMAAAYKIIPGVVKIINHLAQVNTYSYTIAGLTGDISTVPASNKTIGKIEVRNISFGYRQPLLHAFSCSLVPGDMAGIAAVSGKGKSTLVNLLLGFEEIHSGEILFNGDVVNAAARMQFRNDIAYVKQQPFLVHDSIRNNITLSNEVPDAGWLNEILRVTGIHNWLTSSGLDPDFVVKENGRNISGGQQQRIAIARALFKNAGVIILDEPFSELDHASEEKLLQHFRQLATGGKIIVLISHKQQSLSYCNKIIWADA